MFLRHPFDWIPAMARQRAFIVSFVATLFVMAVFQFLLDPPLRTAAAPAGIVSFELAGTTDKAFQIMVSWENVKTDNTAPLPETLPLLAALGLGFDFLFMPIYASALSLGILLAAKGRSGVWPLAGNVLGWGALIAPIFDAIENVVLFKILLGGAIAPHPQIAFWCASIKFSLIILGILYGLIGWLFPHQK